MLGTSSHQSAKESKAKSAGTAGTHGESDAHLPEHAKLGRVDAVEVNSAGRGPALIPAESPPETSPQQGHLRHSMPYETNKDNCSNGKASTGSLPTELASVEIRRVVDASSNYSPAPSPAHSAMTQTSEPALVVFSGGTAFNSVAGANQSMFWHSKGQPAVCLSAYRPKHDDKQFLRIAGRLNMLWAIICPNCPICPICFGVRPILDKLWRSFSRKQLSFCRAAMR